MALQTDFELDGVIHRNCYLRIHKIRTQISEFEYFETFENVVDTNVVERLVWKSRSESIATACVWIDRPARDNRALPMKTFTFEFDYDFVDTPFYTDTDTYNCKCTYTCACLLQLFF